MRKLNLFIFLFVASLSFQVVRKINRLPLIIQVQLMDTDWMKNIVKESESEKDDEISMTRFIPTRWFKSPLSRRRK